MAFMRLRDARDRHPWVGFIRNGSFMAVPVTQVGVPPQVATALAHDGTACQSRSDGVVKYRPKVTGETATADEVPSTSKETTA